MKVVLPKVEEFSKAKITGKGGSSSEGGQYERQAAPRQKKVNRGYAQTRPPRKGLKGRNLAKKATEEDRDVSLVGVQGAGVVLPSIQDDDPMGTQMQDLSNSGFQLPILPTGNAAGASRYLADIELEVAGQDLQLPPPKAITQPLRQPKEPQQKQFQPGGFQLLEPCIAEEDEDEWEEHKDVRQLQDALNCHSIGIPLEIVRAAHVPGKMARPLFHCVRCQMHWERHGKLLQDCDQPQNPVRGTPIQLTSNAAEVLKTLLAKNTAPSPQSDEKELKKLLRELPTNADEGLQDPGGEPHVGTREQKKTGKEGKTVVGSGDSSMSSCTTWSHSSKGSGKATNVEQNQEKTRPRRKKKVKEKDRKKESDDEDKTVIQEIGKKKQKKSKYENIIDKPSDEEMNTLKPGSEPGSLDIPEPKDMQKDTRRKRKPKNSDLENGKAERSSKQVEGCDDDNEEEIQLSQGSSDIDNEYKNSKNDDTKRRSLRRERRRKERMERKERRQRRKRKEGKEYDEANEGREVRDKKDRKESKKRKEKMERKQKRNRKNRDLPSETSQREIRVTRKETYSDETGTDKSLSSSSDEDLKTSSVYITLGVETKTHDHGSRRERREREYKNRMLKQRAKAKTVAAGLNTTYSTEYSLSDSDWSESESSFEETSTYSSCSEDTVSQTDIEIEMEIVEVDPRKKQGRRHDSKKKNQQPSRTREIIRTLAGEEKDTPKSNDVTKSSPMRKSESKQPVKGEERETVSSTTDHSKKQTKAVTQTIDVDHKTPLTEKAIPGETKEQDTSRSYEIQNDSGSDLEQEFVLPGHMYTEGGPGNSYDDMLKHLVEEYDQAQEPKKDSLMQVEHVESRNEENDPGTPEIDITGYDKSQSNQGSSPSKTFTPSTAQSTSVFEGAEAGEISGTESEWIGQQSESYMTDISLSNASIYEQESIRRTSMAAQNLGSTPGSGQSSSASPAIKQRRNKLQRAVIRNPLVRNKTGRPQTQMGQLQRNVMKTVSNTEADMSSGTTLNMQGSTDTTVRLTDSAAYGQFSRQNSAKPDSVRSVAATSPLAAGKSAAGVNQNTAGGPRSPAGQSDGRVGSAYLERRRSMAVKTKKEVEVTRSPSQAHHSWDINSRGEHGQEADKGAGLKSTASDLAQTNHRFKSSPSGAVIRLQQSDSRQRTANAMGPAGFSRPSSSQNQSGKYGQSCNGWESQAGLEGYDDSFTMGGKRVAEVKPLCQTQDQADGRAPGAGRNDSASSVSSITVESSTEESVMSLTQMLQKNALVLENLAGLSILSFTPAFSFSVFSLPPGYERHNTSLQSKGKGKGKGKKRTKGAPAKGPGKPKTTTKVPVPLPPGRNADGRPKPRPPKVNRVANMARRMQNKIMSERPVGSYMKKLAPVPEKSISGIDGKSRQFSQSIQKASTPVMQNYQRNENAAVPNEQDVQPPGNNDGQRMTNSDEPHDDQYSDEGHDVPTNDQASSAVGNVTSSTSMGFQVGNCIATDSVLIRVEDLNPLNLDQT